MEEAIVLPQQLNINVVGNLLKEIRDAVSNSDNIVLDAQNVEEIDALGMQLILSLEKTASMNGVKFQLINAKDELKKVLAYSELV